MRFSYHIVINLEFEDEFKTAISRLNAVPHWSMLTRGNLSNVADYLVRLTEDELTILRLSCTILKAIKIPT